ncbi:MAG: hypothetical protein WD847_11440 [Pirellulales bacterium]
MAHAKHSKARELSIHTLLQSIRAGNRQVLGTLSTDRQRMAITAAKRARIQASGLVTRIRAHMSARGRRSQFRRDARS